MAAADGPGYGLDNAWRDARARLSSLEDWLDPGTIGHLPGPGLLLPVPADHRRLGPAPVALVAAETGVLS